MEFDLVVPPSRRLQVAVKQFSLGLVRSGVRVTFSADTDAIHLLTVGVRLKSMCSHLWRGPYRRWNVDSPQLPRDRGGVMDFVEFMIDGPLAVDRDDIEDELNRALLGRGEVTGAGTSESGSLLDVDVRATADRRAVLDAIFGVLAALEVGDSVRVRPGDEQTWLRPSEWEPS
ncbi:hypothetical protein ACFO0M_17275 [Micromonospora mangrovi]|uniref:Uncharacterized protein n=2 Tax=Micromonospora TaxID=1873 RepID=A0AAU7MB79_9ACTN